MSGPMPLMVPQYDTIATTAAVAWQATQADADELVHLLTGRRVRAADGDPGHAVWFIMDDTAYRATYRVICEWWKRLPGRPWGTRMAGIGDVHVVALGDDR